MDGKTNRGKRWIAICAAILLAPTLLAPFLTAPGAQAGSVSLSAEEAHLLNLLNQTRTQSGLAPLYVEQRLTNMARDLSNEMATYGFFDHDSPYTGTFGQRLASHGLSDWLQAAENIAAARDADRAFQSLMGSTGHRENMLNPTFNCVGIGVAQDANGLLVTMDFMQFASLPATADPGSVPGGSSFDTYILLSNPGSADADVTVDLQKEDGAQQQVEFTIPARSRYTLPLTPEGQGCFSFSSSVTSSVPVVAERAMYFNYAARDGGHVSLGAVNPGQHWYFAEGYSGGEFDTYLLLHNPGSGAASVSLSFMREDGVTIPLSVSMPGHARATVFADGIPGLESTSFSTQVTSEQPVVAERAMYFNYGGRRGGHDSLGADGLSRSWYFAEGYTGGNFDTYILLQNPGSAAARANLTFMREDGVALPSTVLVPAHARQTVHADSVSGLEATSFSTQIDSDQPLVAERAMYFSCAGRDGGHDSVGAPGLSAHWYFAEGYTGGDFDTYLLLLNPQDRTAGVDLAFMREDESAVPLHVDIPARSRYTVHVDEVPGLADAAFSTTVRSDLAIVAERAMYFNYQGRTDGHDTMGATALSIQWFFAEGCVR